VLFPLVITWLCDTAAMAAGSTIGGAKLAPVLSPKKTWAGAIGGATAALVTAVAVGVLVLGPLGWQLPLPLLVAAGLAVGVIGQLGDVVESLFKREAGVKDSSTLIPGHGGVLDRLDSLYYVIPVVAILLAASGAI
jgi:phosphatidate cytidylyltransferase